MNTLTNPHNNDNMQTMLRPMFMEWKAVLETMRAYFSVSCQNSMLKFSIQIARVNSTHAKVLLIQLHCGKYLQAHGLSCQWTSEHVTPIITCHYETLKHWHKCLTWSKYKKQKKETQCIRTHQMQQFQWENWKTPTHREQRSAKNSESNQNFSEITTRLSVSIGFLVSLMDSKLHRYIV